MIDDLDRHGVQHFFVFCIGFPKTAEPNDLAYLIERLVQCSKCRPIDLPDNIIKAIIRCYDIDRDTELDFARFVRLADLRH